MSVARVVMAGAVLAVLVLSAVAVLSSPPHRIGVLPTTSILADGEELTYEVRWTFFKLGTIRIVTRGDYSSTAYIDSYDDVPFVELHSVHSTQMDSLFRSVSSRSLELVDGRWKGLEYRYDHARGMVYVDEIVCAKPADAPSSVVPKDTIPVGRRDFVDGLSIAFYPRRYVHTGQTVSVPTILYGKLGQTTFDFSADTRNEEIDSHPGPIRVIEVQGSTSVVGVYGMTGGFTGWFTDDSSAVPVKGELKVLIGNVDVELIRWKRGAWTPPI